MIDSAASSKIRSKPLAKSNSWKNYLLLGLIANALLWTTALVYLKFKSPVYASQWAITIPVSNSSTSVDLPGIGRANSENESPFRDDEQDPRENYKFLASSAEVITAAANQLSLLPEEFGEPRINIIDNTSLMELEIRGNSPQQAQEKAVALHQALENKLKSLRTEENNQQDGGLKVLLDNSQQNLLQAQQKLLAYQANSGLSSQQQLQDLSSNIEELRRNHAETVARLEETKTRFLQISAHLGLSAQDAASALVLRSDELFQSYLKDYTTNSAQLATLGARFSDSHPQVIDKKAQRDNSQTELLRRAQSLLGRPISTATLTLPNLGRNSASGDKLFEELISLQAAQEGLESRSQELAQQIKQLDNRLKTLAQQGSKLGDLQRNVQVAEAVFSSTLTRLDLSKSNIYSSYPQMQILTQASLPNQPSSPKTKLLWLGTGLGSFLITTGIVSLWWREQYFQRSSSLIKK